MPVMAAGLVAVIAVGVWWTSNTVAHLFIHRPFFATRASNLLFSASLSVALGIPQRLWRERHLAHHRGGEWRLQPSAQLVAETALVGLAWAAMAFTRPAFFASTYVPGYVLGLGLCWVQGHYEHAHGTTSHYGRFYNVLCFNDGYHVEHHANPAVHWARLPAFRVPNARSSRWPAPLRWLDSVNESLSLVSSLERLERLVLRHEALQRFVLRSHRRAFAAILPTLPSIRQVAIVGGGLFPRTALILRELLPNARIVIVDASRENIATASSILGEHDIHSECRLYRPTDETAGRFDLVVIPLSFRGDRHALYRHPPATPLLVHDWIWNRSGEGRVVSIALLKRLNLVHP